MRTIIFVCCVISLSFAWNIDGSCKIDLGEGDKPEKPKASEEEYYYEYSDEYDYYDYTNGEILDTDIDQMFKVFTGVDMKGVSISNNRYFTAKLVDNEIQLWTTKNFENFEYEQSSDNEIRETIQLKLECANGSVELSFYQPIKDTNNHTPFFNRKEYNYRFGMDLKKGFELTKLVEIFATDIDYTNTKLNFAIQDNDFLTIEYKGQSNHYKTYHAALVTKYDITGPLNKEFKITATDTAKDSKVGEATVRLIID